MWQWLSSLQLLNYCQEVNMFHSEWENNLSSLCQVTKFCFKSIFVSIAIEFATLFESIFSSICIGHNSWRRTVEGEM
jgi:hypothetical protein